jgi:Putative prokaryotic signal transducing protein
MTTVARCLTIDQALFLKSLLEGCGVAAFVPDELTAQTDPVIFMGSMNSIRVQVQDADAETARAVLKQNDFSAAE